MPWEERMKIRWGVMLAGVMRILWVKMQGGRGDAAAGFEEGMERLRGAIMRGSGFSARGTAGFEEGGGDTAVKNKPILT